MSETTAESIARNALADPDGLVKRAFANMGRKARRQYRWVHVKNTFAHGMGVSIALCLALDLDPWEEIGYDPASDEEAEDE